MTNNEIKAEIHRAFDEVKLGDGIGLWEAQAIDDYQGKEEQQKNRAKDEKENWQNIPVEALNACFSSPCFFDAEGMRFHLPAFIIAEIDDVYNFDFVFTLTHLTDYTLSQFSLLNKTQKTAVTKFLRWCLEKDSYRYSWTKIERAIHEYWDSSKL
jgi:hypothetical protein